MNPKFAPMDRYHIPSFLNAMTLVDWSTYLPIFRDGNGEDVALHLVKFHNHVCRLEVVFHDDSLMKMFMETLEGNTRSWYEGLPTASLCSLMDFYSIFCINFKQTHPSIVLIERFCGKFNDMF